MVSSAIVTCSPVESSMSICADRAPRKSGARAPEARRSSCPSRRRPRPSGCRARFAATRRATFAIFSASATEDPPNFWTSSAMLAEAYTTRRRIASSAAPAEGGARLTTDARARVGGLGEAHVLAEEVEPAEERDRQDLARVEEQRVADSRRVRDAEEPDGEHRRGVEDADVARSGRDQRCRARRRRAPPRPR